VVVVPIQNCHLLPISDLFKKINGKRQEKIGEQSFEQTQAPEITKRGNIKKEERNNIPKRTKTPPN
jgi:hypothetical protein